MASSPNGCAHSASYVLSICFLLGNICGQLCKAGCASSFMCGGRLQGFLVVDRVLSKVEFSTQVRRGSALRKECLPFVFQGIDAFLFSMQPFHCGNLPGFNNIKSTFAKERLNLIRFSREFILGNILVDILISTFYICISIPTFISLSIHTLFS